MKLRKRWIVAVLFAFMFSILALAGCAQNEPEPNAEQQTAEQKDIILATTTSTYDTGLLDVLIPEFEEKTGYRVKPIAVGTGQALEMGQKGEADVLLTHAPKSEQPLVDSGEVTNYQLVMHNDFIIVGPAEDPAKIKDIESVTDAFKQIADSNATFVSRGDDSGTHKKEKGVWEKADLTPSGDWYLEAGSGMADTLRLASEKGGYTLTDRGTYLAQKENLNLDILLEGDKMLLNIYHVMQVNPEKFPKVNAEGAKQFVDFMVAPETQEIIKDFGKDKYGQPLFVPDAGKNEEEIGK